MNCLALNSKSSRLTYHHLLIFLLKDSREEREQRDLEQLPKIRRQSSETAMSSKDISRAMQDDDKLAVTIYSSFGSI